jgi:dCMP deaminase
VIIKPKFIKAFMKCAEAFAECSPANRLQVGTVLVKDNRIISCGYNAMPAHINDPCELPDGTTDPRVRHSEKNALMGLVRSGQSSVGATAFCTHACCLYCAIDLVDAGISEVYYKNSYRNTEGIGYLLSYGLPVYKVLGDYSIQPTKEPYEDANAGSYQRYKAPESIRNQCCSSC